MGVFQCPPERLTSHFRETYIMQCRIALSVSYFMQFIFRNSWHIMELSTLAISAELFASMYHVPTVSIHMGVSKNRGTPKWMVYNGNPY